MTLIEYVGPHRDGVFIPHDGLEIHAELGVAIDVPDDLAAGLLEQPANWQAPKSKAARSGSKEGVTDVP